MEIQIPITKEKIEEIVKDFANDRNICDILKVNYPNPSHEDIEKIRDYVKRFCGGYYLSREEVKK